MKCTRTVAATVALAWSLAGSSACEFEVTADAPPMGTGGPGDMTVPVPGSGTADIRVPPEGTVSWVIRPTTDGGTVAAALDAAVPDPPSGPVDAGLPPPDAATAPMERTLTFTATTSLNVGLSRGAKYVLVHYAADQNAANRVDVTLPGSPHPSARLAPGERFEWTRPMPSGVLKAELISPPKDTLLYLTLVVDASN